MSDERGRMKTSATPVPTTIKPFWGRFAEHLGHDPGDRFYEAFHFDDNAPSADELAELVLCGTKGATAGLLWAFEAEGKPLPRPGDLSVVTKWSGAPVCVVETWSVEIVPFQDVSAEFAAIEGEGDGSLDYWRKAHTAFFRRECARIGRTFEPSAPVVCEKFKMVFPLQGKNAS